MARILGFYIIREMTVPTILSLFTITIVLFIKLVFDKLNLLFMAGIDPLTLLTILLNFAPSIVVFALPMALLMGIIIGVSRLTMDNEIIAIRAHGINLFKLFVPAMVFTAALCGLLFYISTTVAPQMMHRGLQRIVALQITVINALKPGEFHDELTGDDDGLVFYFKSRNPENGRMQGIVLKFERPYEPEWKRAFFANAKQVEERRKRGEIVLGTPLRDYYPGPSEEPAYRTYLTSEGTMRKEYLEQTAEPAPPNIEFLHKGAGYIEDGFEDGDIWKYSYPTAELMTVFAEEGEIGSKVITEDGSGPREVMIELALYNGSIHHLSVNPEHPDYLTVNFDEGRKRLFQNATIESIQKTNTNERLREIIADPDTKDDARRYARRELGERLAIAPAMFVFMMFGVPLAIRLRPTGRSWGIMLAIGLMLIYYLLMKSGVSIYERGHAHGMLLAFLPNVLYLILGLTLWWRALRA